MKRSIALVVTFAAQLLAVPLFGQKEQRVNVNGQKEQTVNVKYDKFKDRTVIDTESYSIGGAKGELAILVPEMEMTAAVVCSGKATSCTAGRIELLFIAHTNDWRLHDHVQGRLLIDGRRAVLGKGSWDGQVMDADDLHEYIDFNITVALLRQLARAKHVELQLGSFEFEISADNLAILDDLSQHVK